MSRARRLREAAREQTDFAMTFGAVEHHDDAAGVELVKQHVHDQVIALTGPARRSGVVWRFYSTDQGLALLADLRDQARPLPGLNDDEGEAAISDYLTKHPHSLLVVATVEVDLRAAAAGLS